LSPRALTAWLLSYNVGVLASVLAHPGFKDTLEELDAPQSGLITAIYYLGSWLSYVFLAHPLADRFGRRYAAVAGMSVTCIGQALQVGASRPSAFAMVIAGRIIGGLGSAIISTSVPLYQR
jgi:MFS family permease